MSANTHTHTPLNLLEGAQVRVWTSIPPYGCILPGMDEILGTNNKTSE